MTTSARVLRAPRREAERRQAVGELIRSRLIGTQEELRELLLDRGFDVTQATLSRDLGKLGARRVQLDAGGTAYELPGAPVEHDATALEAMQSMVTEVVDTDALVVVRTLPGGASPVALAIDRARLPEVAGTVAGDDTLFVAPARGVGSTRLARRLRALWKKMERQK
jgi:transcriptional regulator of arginine metabolism